MSVYLPINMRTTKVYFNSLAAAQKHLDIVVGVPPVFVPLKRRVRVKKPPKTKPFSRPGWTEDPDGSYSRVGSTDVFGRVSEGHFGGSYIATFTDGRIFMEHDFSRASHVITNVVKRKDKDGNEYDEIISTEYPYSRDDRFDMALDWVDAQFDMPSTQEALGKPLTPRQIVLRESRIKKAIKAGVLDPAMTPEQRAEADAVAIELRKPVRPKPKKTTVIPYKPPVDPGRGKAGVRGRSAGGRASNVHVPVPLLPPADRGPGVHNPGMRGPGGYSNYENPQDLGLTWQIDWDHNRRSVSRDGRPIGHVRRQIREQPDGVVVITYFADYFDGTKEHQSDIPWRDDDEGWAATQWLAAEDMKGDQERVIGGIFPMPEGFSPVPDMEGEVSWRAANVRGVPVRQVAIRGENIGNVRRLRERIVKQPPKGGGKAVNVKVPVKDVVWVVMPKRGVHDREYRTEKRAVEGLVAHWKRQRAKDGTPVVVVPATPVSVPLPKKTRKVRVTRPDPAKPRSRTARVTTSEYPVILQQGAGKPSKKPKAPKNVDTSVEALLRRTGINKKFRKTRPADIPVGTGPLPRSSMNVPRLIRQTYDGDTYLAARAFEASVDKHGGLRVPPSVRDDLRQMEATGEFIWMPETYLNLPNQEPAWVFGQVVDGVRVGEVLAISQPDFDNFIFDPYLIEETLADVVDRYGDNLPARATRKALDIAVERKVIRHIRTPEGVRKYGGNIGDVIDTDAPVPSARRSSFSGSTTIPKGTATATPSGHPKPKKRVRVAQSIRAKLRRGDSQTPSGHPKPDRAVDVEKVKTLPEQRLAGIDTSVHTAKDFTPERAAAILKDVSPVGFDDGEGTPQKPINCRKNVAKAAKLMAEGKHVRLDSIKEVSILMEEFAKLNDEARASDDPDVELKLRQTYDLCLVHVKKANLFCEQNQGIPRQHMPQFKGEAVPSSYAEATWNGKEADVVEEFFHMTNALGIARKEIKVNPSHLKATQTELVASQVSGMRKAIREGKFKPGAIIVTRDGYIVDGHHTWAAQLGLDMEDGVLGNYEMPVIELDADIGYIYDLAMGFTQIAGIKPKGAGAAATAAVGAKSLYDAAGCCGPVSPVDGPES